LDGSVGRWEERERGRERNKRGMLMEMQRQKKKNDGEEGISYFRNSHDRSSF
jgi:hypothetical protein